MMLDASIRGWDAHALAGSPGSELRTSSPAGESRPRDHMSEPTSERAISRLLWLIVGGIVAAAATVGVNAYERGEAHALNYGIVGYDAFVDTKYIPILGTTFARDHSTMIYLTVVNAGRLPERDVHVRIAGVGQIIFAVPDPNTRATTCDGRHLDSFEEFAGQSSIQFLIKSLPAGATYTLQLTTYAGPSPQLPQVSVKADECIGARASSNAKWCEGMEKVLRSMLCDEEGEAIVQLRW